MPAVRSVDGAKAYPKDSSIPHRNTSMVVIAGIRVVQVRLAIIVNIRVRHVQIALDALM